MTRYEIDNALGLDGDKVVLWQYEHAPNLLAILDVIARFYGEAVDGFWTGWLRRLSLARVEDGVATADDYGLSVWGKILGVPRLSLSFTEDGGSAATARPVSTELYRRMLLGKIRLLDGDASFPSYQAYVDLIFGAGSVVVTDGEDMSLSFAVASGASLTPEELALFGSFADDVCVYPTGVKSSDQDDGPVFGFAEQVRPAITSEDGQTVEAGYQQTVGTYVLVRIYGTAETEIPNTAKFTNNGHDYVISEAATIGADGYVDAMFVYGGKDYVEARSVHALSGIGDITVTATNIGRSITDFTIAGLDESTIAWDREPVRETSK